ncbi:TetR family transcriptional regulator [Rhodococcus hoagii]|nr:TetR family transcriptional regulator [Prescottella equi]
MTSAARQRVVSQLIAAARPLFAEKGPSRVSLREIAAAAKVNYGLIHQYIGSKDDLLKLVLQQASVDWADMFAEATSAEDAMTHIMKPKSSEYARIVAQAVLDGKAPETLLGKSPALTELSRRLRDEIEPTRSTEDDTRLRVAAITGLSLGWGLFGKYVQEIAGLGDLPEDDVTEAVYALLRRSIVSN